MAVDTAFIMIASILACFDINPAVDKMTGQPIEVSEEVISGVVSWVLSETMRLVPNKSIKFGI